MVQHEEILKRVTELLERLNIRYMVVGSIASSFYGSPRASIDVDILIDIPYASVSEFCKGFPSPDFYLEEESVRQAISRGGQFNLIEPKTGEKVDFMAMRYGTYQEDQMARRIRVPLMADLPAFVARPEDIVLGKMLYFQEGRSEKHLNDIKGIFNESGEDLDWPYMNAQVLRLRLNDVWSYVLRFAGRTPDGRCVNSQR